MAAPANYTPLPIIPQSHPQLHHPPPNSTPPFSLPAINQSPYYALGLGFIRKFREERLSSLRPISQFLDFNRFSKPDNIATVASRLGYNLTYFQSNYTVVFLGISAWNVINNAMLVFSVGFVYGGLQIISMVPKEGITIGANKYNPPQLKTGLVCAAVPLFFFSSTIGTVFYIIGASAVTILGHAAFMQETIENNNISEVV